MQSCACSFKAGKRSLLSSVVISAILLAVGAHRMPSAKQVLSNATTQNLAGRHARKLANAADSMDKAMKTGAAAALHAFEVDFEKKYSFFAEAMQHAKLSTTEMAAMKPFKDFLRANYRHYFQFGDTNEYKTRLGYFRKTLENIEIRNKHEQTHIKHTTPATHGVTKYADWSEEEFKTILGYKRAEAQVNEVAGSGAKEAGAKEEASTNSSIMGKIKDAFGLGSLVQQRGTFRKPGGDKFGNCKAIEQAYGCHAKLSNGMSMADACPEECGHIPSGPTDKYSNCASIYKQHGCNVQLNGGETMSHACPEECPPSSSSSGTSSNKVPCNHNWASNIQVRNQGACGDCWAFATVEAIRAAMIKQHGQDPGKLSTQFLVDCMMHRTCKGGVNGCCGGNPFTAMQWIEQQGGLPTQSDYGDYFKDAHELFLLQNHSSFLEGGPVSHSGQGITFSGNYPTKVFECKSGIPKTVKLSGQVHNVQGEENMANHVCNEGTLAIAVDASSWQTYTGGVLSSMSCGRRLDHAVHAIGLDKPGNSWIVQNSWGPDWGVTLDGVSVPRDKYSNCAELAKQYGCKVHVKGGMTLRDACPLSCHRAISSSPGTGGFIMLAYGENTCGIAKQATAVPTIGSV